MGSTAQWRDVYGEEYAPIGLRLFAWWKKNRKNEASESGQRLCAN
jgi:hypothetical protein